MERPTEIVVYGEVMNISEREVLISLAKKTGLDIQPTHHLVSGITGKSIYEAWPD
jgi:predicted DsbA family dithiol-disulfide isomerase